MSIYIGNYHDDLPMAIRLMQYKLGGKIVARLW